MLVSSLKSPDYENLIEILARAAHEANRAFCIFNGDNSLLPWDETAEGIKKSAISGVMFFLEKNATPQEQHAEWSKFKIAQGYVYGEVKDDEKKTHPCLVPYEELPAFQQAKDKLFQDSIRSMLSAIGYVTV